MYSIGRFSKITGVSNKTLIWYDKVGLLKPVKVDPENGYRYYNEESFKTLANIHFWQEMDFSIKEITNLSKEIIEDKIKELKNKISFISMNISLLENFQEGNMEYNNLSIFDAGRRLLQGNWYYSKSTTSFKNALDSLAKADRDYTMPNNLYFGDKCVGTDLNNIFNYQDDEFSLKKSGCEMVKKYCYFIVNHYNTLVIYEKIDEVNNNQTVVFHVYDRSFKKPYTDEEIHIIYEKAHRLNSLIEISPNFDNKIVGIWKIYDMIPESKIDNYDGIVKENDACFALSPMFDYLEIMAPEAGQLADVFTMQEDDEFKIKGSNGEIKIFRRENTICKIGAGIEGHKNEYILCNNMTNAKQVVFYKLINGEEYLFVDLDNKRELDEDIYVYKRDVNDSLFKKLENDDPEFDFISEEDLDNLVKNNKIKLYLPFGFRYRNSDTSSFVNPTVEINIPEKRFVVIGDYCERTNKDKNESIGSHGGKESLGKMLQYYKQIIEYHSEQCKRVDVSNYCMSFYFDEKHYVIPLIYNGKDEKLKKEVEGAMRTAKVILDGLDYWFDICMRNKE